MGSESVAVAGDAHPERPPSDPGRVAGPFGEGFGEGPPNSRPGLVPFVFSTPKPSPIRVSFGAKNGFTHINEEDVLKKAKAFKDSVK